MTANITIKIEPREPGKHIARQMRMNNLVPGVLYGPKTDSYPLALSSKTFEKYSRLMQENVILTLECTDSKVNDVKVLIKKIDVHPVTHNPVHIDFFAPDMTSAISAR